jgi:hypothetical protein
MEVVMNSSLKEVMKHAPLIRRHQQTIRSFRFVLIVSSCLFVSPVGAFATTYYISPTGNDTTGAGTNGSPWRTLTKAFSVGGGGNTFVLKDGTYNSGVALTTPPNGSPSAYTIVKAENDGGVVITQSGSLALQSTVQYVQFEGLKWDDPSQKSILGNHLKFFRCGFRGGPSTGNNTNTTVGSNDFNNTAYILFEDCWWWGPGGRYNLLVYNSDKVICRRCVVRHDGGWDDQGSQDPEAGINFYNSSDCLAENSIVLDSEGPFDTWAGSFYSVKNSSTSHATNNNSWIGCIALRSDRMGLALDTDSSTGNVIQDCVLWDARNGGISFGTGSASLTMNRLTIGRSQLSASGDFKGGIGSWGSGTKTVTNTIITNYTTGSDLDGVSATYFDTYSNGSTSTGAGRVIYNPQTNGLIGLPRIENGTPLKTAGSSGGQIGARIVTQIGTSSSLWGESGYNTDTGISLWPWPYESRIKNDMCAGITRGWCGTSKTLTDYIWTYLGNPVPSDISGGSTPPSTPANLLVQ